MMVNQNPEIPIQFNSQTYEYDYFSGSQISIYFGNLLVDDIEAIQFSVSQSKRPIYGYASQYFHSVADGQVIVEGSFVIAFKESNYIISALNYYQNKAPIELQKEKDQYKHVVSGRNVDLEYYFKNQGEKSDLGKNTLDLNVLESVIALDDNAWERTAEDFQNYLWKSKKGADSDYLTGNLAVGAVGQETMNEYRRADQYPSIDIWVLYGDLSRPSTNTTIKKLIDVHIIGEGQTIQVGGDNIHEEYRFFARNLA